MTKKDRSRFLDSLDQIIQKIRREMPGETGDES
jgi:hypothetical protein